MASNYKKEEQEAIAYALANDPELKKLEQKLARLQDELANKKKKISEKERKIRDRRIYTLGATIEKFWGGSIVDGSKEMGCLIYYLPQIKKLYDEGKYDAKWEELKQKEKAVQDKIKREEAERQKRAEQVAQNEEEN